MLSKKNKNYLMVAGLLALSAACSQAADFQTTRPGVKMRHIGPGAGGSMFGMAFKPDDPNVVLLGGDMGAGYRSVDGGKNWTIINGTARKRPRASWNFKFHPKSTNLVWYAGNQVLKSVDGGKTWIDTQIANGTYDALGIDPDNPKILYVSEGQSPRMVLNWTKGKIYKTVNGGKRWRRLPSPFTPRKRGIKHPNYTNFIVDPTSKVGPDGGHLRVYIFGRGGAYRSENGGKGWKDISAEFAPGQVNEMVMAQIGGKPVLFLSVVPAAGLNKGGIYKSVDNGNSWVPVNKGLEPLIQRLKVRNKGLKSNPESALFALRLVHSKADPKRLYAGSWQGIYRSDDAGASWYELIPAEGARYIKDKFGHYTTIPKQGNHFTNTIWGGIDSFNGFIVDQKNPDRLAFTDNQDMYISLDGGKNWRGVSFKYGKPFDPKLYPNTEVNRYTHAVISTGVQNLVTDQINIDPFDPQTYYAASMDVGVQISRDGGKSWEHPTRGTPARGHAWCVVPDPGKKGRVYLTIGQKWGQPGGIYRSDDQGRKWTRIGMKDASMGKFQTVAIDLNSPVNSRTLYVGSAKNGLYKTTDGGKSWKNIQVSTVKGAKNVTAVAVIPGTSKTVYAGTGAGLFKSTDTGNSWQQIGKGKFEQVRNISICQSRPTTIYVCAHYPKQNFYWGKAGFWRSDNAGKSFSDITPKQFKYSGAIAVNPVNPKYIYGCNNLFEPLNKKQQMAIMRSKDGGSTWQNISGKFAFGRGAHLSVDSKNPHKFFVLTRFAIIEGIDNDAPTK